MKGLRESAIRTLFGYDIFVSYSRADSATYAVRLAGELTERGFYCRLDQWGSRPGTEVPPELLRDLRRSSMLVVVGSAAAATSTAVENEIREFLPTKRYVIPISHDGAIYSAKWWPLLEGLAVVNESPIGGGPLTAPSRDTIERIVNTATFTRRTKRLRNLSAVALTVFGVLIVLIGIAGKRAKDATQQANKESVLAAAAITQRKKAESEAKNQQGLAAKANRDRELAEAKRSEALRKLVETVASLKQKSAEAKSLELARQANIVSERQDRLQKAIDAMETNATDAAREALVSAILNVINNDRIKYNRQPFAVDSLGEFVATADKHGKGELVNINSGHNVQLCGSPEPIELLSFSPNSRYLITARQHHYEQKPYNKEEIWELQLWDTLSGLALSSIQVTGKPGEAVWSPSSSMYILKEQFGNIYQINISPNGKQTLLSLSRFALPPEVVFSKSRSMFLMYKKMDDTGVSLWDFNGNKLWESKHSADWAVFSNDSSRLFTALWPQLSPTEKYEFQFEVLKLDSEGRPSGQSTLVPSSRFDFRMLPTGLSDPYQLRSTLGDRLKNFNPPLIKECSQVVMCDKRGLVLCFQDKLEPALFDVGTLKPAGTLKPWDFGTLMGNPVFSSDGRLLVLASDREWLTAWDTVTWKLQWKTKGNYHPIQFSSDGMRLLVETYGDESEIAILNANTGNTISFFQAKSYDKTSISINPAGTRLIMAEQIGPYGRNNKKLVNWDVDNRTELNRIDLYTSDVDEEKRDKATLNANPSSAALFEIANRRLRRCPSPESSLPKFQARERTRRVSGKVWKKSSH